MVENSNQSTFSRVALCEQRSYATCTILFSYLELAIVDLNFEDFSQNNKC